MRRFCERLRELRNEKGLSLDTISKETGISIATLSRWENGINDITSDNLIVLAKYFNVSTDFLLGLLDY